VTELAEPAIAEVSAIAPPEAGTAQVPVGIALAAVMSRKAPEVGTGVHSEVALEALMGALPGPVVHEVPPAWEAAAASVVVGAAVVAECEAGAAVVAECEAAAAVVEDSGRNLRGKEYESKA
jgi:hypothetical protein